MAEIAEGAAAGEGSAAQGRPADGMPETTTGGPSPVLLHMPVDVRSASLAVLAVLGSLAALRWASVVLIPIMLGLMLSYALTPIVDLMQRLRLPRALASALLMLGIIAGLGSGLYALGDDAAELIESLPQAMEKLRRSIRTSQGPIEIVQQAAATLEKATEDRTPALPAPKGGVTRVQIERPRFDINDYLWSGTLGLAGLVGQVSIVGFIAYFLLASGDTFRRKMVHIAGPTLSRKKVTVQALDEINEQIQRYLLVQLFTSTLVGIATWLAYLWIGLEHAAVWGVAAAALNLVPYLGSIVITGASALVGFLQFGNLDMALTIAAVSALLHCISGYLLTPWLTSRASRMNPVVIFVGVLIWGWLWGIWGLLLGIPILMIVKAVCDRVDHLQPIGELLGD